ncbi:putative acyltransfersase, partial [Coccomyxa subellipsoidea C-169]
LQYGGEQDMYHVMQLVDNELSEPYSIFTYRYFLHNWPKLCWLAFDGAHCFGVVVCKADDHRGAQRGYIAMLVVEHEYRGLGVGTTLVKRAIEEMIAADADEVVLEAEVTNSGALALYRNLGFLRDKRLIRYYMNGADAFRLKLLLPLPPRRQLEHNAVAQMAALRTA